MNLIGCLDTPNHGRILAQRPARSAASKERRARPRIRNKEIGFVFQTFNLLPRASALAQRRAAARSMAPCIAASERKERAMAKRCEAGGARRSVCTTGPNELSGGQRQRVSDRPRTCDAPLRSCSPTSPRATSTRKTSVEIMALFDRLHRAGNTIVVVTHERDIAEHANRIVTIRDGMIASDERFVRAGAP
jgi:putative ABC transport system ATP-binding protein